MRSTHRNSSQAFTGQDFSARERQIIEFLNGRIEPMTAREIAEALGFADLNAVAPRISALIDAHVLAEALDVTCRHTGRRVRTVYLVKRIALVLT